MNLQFNQILIYYRISFYIRHKLYDGDAIFDYQKVYPFSFDSNTLQEWIEKDMVISIYRNQKRKYFFISRKPIKNGKNKNNKQQLTYYGQSTISLRNMIFSNELALRVFLNLYSYQHQ